MTDVESPSAIGGAFALDAAELLSANTPFTVAEGVSVTAGRTALALAAAHLGNGDWLLPAYLCASVLQPLRAAGIGVSFYSVGADLRPRLGTLEPALARGRTSALLVVDYFGFPVEEPDAISALVGDRCAIVEDCVQGSLLELPDAAGGRLGAVSFTSFRKYLPVPDGGVVLGLPETTLPPADGEWMRRRLLGQLLRGIADEQLEPVFLRLLAEGEAALDETTPMRSTSLVSSRLLARLDLQAVAVRRRRNFSDLLALLEERGAFPRIVPLRTELPPGVSPLVLPVRVGGGRRDAVRAALASRRVFCPVHWPLPAAVSRADFPEEHRLADEMLGLPVDQRYGREDMERLADAVAGTLRETE